MARFRYALGSLFNDPTTCQLLDLKRRERPPKEGGGPIMFENGKMSRTVAGKNDRSRDGDLVEGRQSDGPISDSKPNTVVGHTRPMIGQGCVTITILGLGQELLYASGELEYFLPSSYPRMIPFRFPVFETQLARPLPWPQYLTLRNSNSPVIFCDA